jgi:hypothetical protein
MSVNLVLATSPRRQLDTVVFYSGVQHQFDFTKPESIDVQGRDHQLLCHSYLLSLLMNPIAHIVTVKEFDINYIAVFTLITLFLPHLLQLAVSLLSH